MATEIVEEILKNDQYKTLLQSTWQESYEKMQTDMKAMMSEFMDMQLKRMEAMEEKYTKRIAEMEDKCTKQIEQMNSSLMDITNSHGERIKQLENELEVVGASQTSHHNKVDQKIKDIDSENTRLSQETTDQQDQIDDILTNVEEQSKELEDVMQYVRRNTLVITGLKEQKGENTDDIIKNFAASKLDTVVKDSDIDRTHRLGKPSGKPRPIIAKFTSYNIRLKIMKARKKLKGQGIGIHEHLTPFTRHLLAKAKDLTQKAAWIRNAWTWDGRVTVLVETEVGKQRKQVVTCFEDLNKLWELGNNKSRKRRITDPAYNQINWEKTE